MALVLILVVGCKDKAAAPAAGSGAGSGPEPAGSGSALAVGSGSADQPIGEAPPPACELAGKYRVRFTWNGTDGYWLRFTVGGTPAAVTFDSEPHMLQFPPKVEAKLDQEACTIAMTTKRDNQIQLKVDPMTHLVTGELVRPTEKDPYHKTPIAGVHDVPGAKHSIVAPAPCFEPGVYQIALDKTAKWKNVDADDDRSCKETPEMFDPLHVRLEILGDVTLDTVEAKPPYRELALVSETVQIGKGCDVSFKTEPEGIQLDAQLTFAPGGKVTGVGKRAEYQFVEDGDAGENIWSCEAKDIPLMIKRIATP